MNYPHEKTIAFTSPATGWGRAGTLRPWRLAMAALPVFILFFDWGLAIAQPPEFSVGKAGRYPLTPALFYLEDGDRSLSFDDILHPETLKRFQPLVKGNASANFGLTRSAFWFSVTLCAEPAAPSRWLLEFAYPSTDSIELYVPQPGGWFEKMASGDLLPFTARPFPHRNHVFPVDLQPGVPLTLYLRVASAGTVSVPVHLWRPEALWQHDQANYSSLSLYFGMLIGLLLYNLLLYMSLRDRLFLTYVAFVASMAVGQAGLSGLGAQFLWPDWTWWINVSPLVGTSASGLFATMFARSFLSTADKLPRLDRVLIALAVLFLLIVPTAMFLPYRISAWMVNIVGTLFSVLVVVTGAASLRQGHPGARYFLLAWTVLLVSAGVISLHNLGMLPSNPFTTNSLLIGSAVEMLLLSFALADRINVTRLEKEQAQATALATEQLMVEALRQSERQLEARVAERTSELEKTNARLKDNEQLLERQAQHDVLTGLANRKLFNDRLSGAIERAKRSGGGFALLMLDLDGFKKINDNHGHAAGDALLVSVANRLRAAVRAADTVARVGGDEFVLILESLDETGEAAMIREKLAGLLSEPITLAGGDKVRVGASIGLALYPRDGTDPEKLFNYADRAMYESKGKRRRPGGGGS